jgi:plastocyanin domain-containing protein
MRLTTVLAATSLLALSTRPAVARAEPPAQVFRLQVTRDGFVPANLQVKTGVPVKLVVTRTTERTCATEIVIREMGINQPLPLDKPVTVTFTPRQSGTLRYACGMDMISGVIVVQ